MDPSGSRPFTQGGEDREANTYEEGQYSRGAVADPDRSSGPGGNLQAVDENCVRENGKRADIITKEQRGWRRLIRNFTPSYVIFELAPFGTAWRLLGSFSYLKFLLT